MGLFVLTLLLAGVATISALPKEVVPHGWEKIVGGEEATPHEFPWMIDMRQGGHYCGGSLYNHEWVVTAAHCSTGSPSNYELVAGDHHIGQTEGTEQRRRVTRIIRHPGYGSGVQFENDIALMKVESPFVYDQYVQPVAIPNITFAPTTRAIVAGWGALTEGGSSPVVLYKVDVPVVSDAVCRNAYGQTAISDSMICSGEGGKDSCQGDSGGPMMCERDGVLFLCGIVSWGRGCAQAGYPGVYTEMSYFEEWAAQAIMPPVESNDTWVEQRVGCGGVLSGSSGYVSYKLGESYGANETCTWTLQAQDREQIRVRVRNSGLRIDAHLTITEIDFTGAVATTTTRLIDLEDHTFSGPVVFLTFIAGSDAGTGFDFEFYGTQYPDFTQLNYNHHHNGSATGTMSFPAGGGQYQNNAFATFVVNPAGSRTAKLSIDRMNLENGSCSYDFVRVLGLVNGRFQTIGPKYCGTNAPSDRFESDEGVLILTFRTDSSVTGSGFTYTWNDQ